MENDYPDIKTYVEEYYKGTLQPQQKKQFEENIVSDPVFAEEVAFYLNTIAAAKEVRQEETRERFRKIYKQRVPTKKRAPNRIISISRIIIAVAACLIIVAGIYFFAGRNEDPQQLAGTYIKENLTQLPQTLGETDSLQQGIALFNKQQYDSAIVLFKGIYINHPDNSEAKMNTGLAYLEKKNYNDALQQFDELANMHGLYADRALFYKAITLMERNDKGDKEEAKQLLDVIKQQKLYGAEQAVEWEKKF
jgi:tetratricopeptide (TPR) repeat protein